MFCGQREFLTLGNFRIRVSLEKKRRTVSGETKIDPGITVEFERPVNTLRHALNARGLLRRQVPRRPVTNAAALLIIRIVLDEMIQRCRELGLRAVGPERKLIMEFTVLLTAKTMHTLFGPSRRRWIAL